MASAAYFSVTAVTPRFDGVYPPSSSNSLRPSFFFNSSLNYSTRLKIVKRNRIVPVHVIKAPTTCCLGGSYSEASNDSGRSDATDHSMTEATVDLKLPRRSLLVHFTCNLCGERSKKLINRLAYERGTVFVQCAGCLKHHKLIDNLGLVVEYDFRENSEINSNEDQL